MMADITDIEQIVLDYAWNTYLETKSRETKLDFKDANIRLDWYNVKFVSDKPEYHNSQVRNVPNMQMLFTSTYINNTETDQEHKVHTERSSVSTCTTEINKGFSKGMSLDLKLSLPGNIAEITSGFGGEITMDTTKHNSVEKNLTWGIENVVKVPRKKSVTVSMEVKEKEFNADFQFNVTIRGRVNVSIHNIRDNNNFVMAITADFAEIMRKHQERNKGTKQPYIVQNRDVMWKVTGTCSIRSGIEQRVTIT